ncbi:hypothetical protein F5B20DRAFT_587646 [Whalleya microplaca]|nr:hypothetical protein F5B20DRAFT_587646 [Whalleya microplaca]
MAFVKQDQVEVMEEASGSSRAPLSEFRRLTVHLPRGEAEATSRSIKINHGNSEDVLTITLNRTIRVPDNRDTNFLPPGLGAFPLYKVLDFANRMPKEMAEKGGVFFPMYQKEAMWIEFSALAPFAIKVYVGGVNAVSGLPMTENEATKQKRLTMLKEGKQIQDYMVVPGQRWLDGIASEDGKIRQFVAQPKGSGFSVEAQVTGEEKVGGIQIEVIPTKRELPEALNVRYTNRQNKVISRDIILQEKGITEHSTWLDLKRVLRDEFDIAIQDQLLRSHDAGSRGYSNVKDGSKLGDYYFKPNETFDLNHCGRIPELFVEDVYYNQAYNPAAAHVFPPRQSSRNPPSKKVMAKSSEMRSSGVQEMGLAAGGRIKQSIKPDDQPSSTWDIGASIMFNIQILDAESFAEVTGVPPQPSPINAQTYAQYDYPFFEIWGEENTGIKGDFSKVKSVAQIEADRARERGEGYEEEPSVPQRVSTITTFNSTFQPKNVMMKELEGMSFEFGDQL